MSDQEKVDNPAYVAESLGSGVEETRRLAVVALSSRPLGETWNYLLRAMGDQSWRVRKEAVEVFLSSSGAGAFIEQVFDLLRSQDNAGLRNSAAETLVRLGKLSMPVLISHATDQDPDVRKYVIDILGAVGDPDAVAVLLRALGDDDPNVAMAAAENLGRTGNAQAVQPLLAALGRADITLRYAIFEALGRIGAPVPLNVLIPFLTDDLLKKAVYECLGSVGEMDAVELLVKGLAEPGRGVRETAVRALMRILGRSSSDFDAEAFTTLLKEIAGARVVSNLVSILDGADIPLQRAVIRILGIIGDGSAFSSILRACGNENLFQECIQSLRGMDIAPDSLLEEEFTCADERERAVIMRLCGKLLMSEPQSLLRKGMADPSPLVREAAVAAVGKGGHTALLPETVALLKDSNQDVRMSALDALAELARSDGTSVAKIATSLATATTPDKRRNAAYLYGVLRDRERLALLMKDEDDLVRRTAIQGLSGFPCTDTFHHLTLALTDESPEVRIASVTALGESGRDDAVDALVLAARDDNTLVRCAALRSLGRIGGERALDEIESAFDGADGLVALAALDALTHFDNERSRKLARRAATSDEVDVVKAAVDVLADREDPWLDKHAEEFLTHSHWDVRNVIVCFMAKRQGRGAIPSLRRALETESDALVRRRIIELLEALS